MQQLKVFLASSSELKTDREQFELFINRQNKRLIRQGIFVELIIWEDFLDALAPDGLQKEYNRAIRECDVFVMLYFTKVGMYTAEEFETAIGAFHEGGKPLIYTYFKDASVAIGGIRREDQQSLWAFQDKLKALGHYQTVYKSTEDLLLKFGGQLERILEGEGFVANASGLRAAPAEDRTTAAEAGIGGIGESEDNDGDVAGPLISPTEGGKPRSNSGSLKKVFISYSTKDQDAKNELCKWLDDNDIAYWLDEKDLAIGQDISKNLQENMRKADLTLLLISPNSLQSGWVGMEAMFRLQEEYTQDRVKLIGIVVDTQVFDPDFPVELQLHFNEEKRKYEERRNRMREAGGDTTVYDIEIQRLTKVNVGELMTKVRNHLGVVWNDPSRMEGDLKKLLKAIEG